MKHVVFAFSLLTAALGGQSLAAEMDASKLTCMDLAAMPAGRVVAVGMWMSGYVHGKAGNTMVDGDAMQANAEKLRDFCVKTPTATIMGALEQLGKS